ncbi:alpha/beta-hydrolase [Phanerochaete sordida]|uniref:triacylglycerol lipase n=1 Tax=Phanerochaete sordida TaxID=48140 RepID=A0A9P3GBD8_9APHY|nr:alpha/beta-hydrolase [Phanerochaete sordida]
MLAYLLLTLSYIRYALAAAVVLERQEITFAPAQEYTLPRHLGVDAQTPLNVAAPPETRTEFSLRARPTTVYRPRNPDVLQHARWRSRHLQESEPVEWEPADILGPDVEDRHTLAQLARMSANAYAQIGQSNWFDIDPIWNTSFPFGWEDAADGFRGHVFLSPDNSTVVLSIKGTTLNGPTSKKDKYNDNLLFSCCCARVDFSWIFSQVCDCYSNHWRCDDTCLSEALIEDSLFYNVGVNLINNLTAMYPTSTIWLAGHSLGGALASLLGSTFGLPAVAFEAPGERLAAQRLHLPLPPSDPLSRGAQPAVPVTHVYHNADPIPQGACTGIGSPCASAGYALETHCHLGRSIVFDTVHKFGWRVDVRKHPIREVILNVLEKELDIGDGWEIGGDGQMREVPIARYEEDCVDCYKWEFGKFKKHKGKLL